MTDHVTLVEVAPRDGLQNEKMRVPAATKVELIQRLTACGLPVVEATSFVSPRWVPQLADAAEVLAGLGLAGEDRRPASPPPPCAGVSAASQPAPGMARYPVLVPNRQGLERAMAAGAREIAVFLAASETFSQHNTHCSIEQSLQRLTPVVAAARANGLRTRGYISCVLGCPYEGVIDPAVVASLAEALATAGCEEISLGDTIGVGTAGQARELILRVSAGVPLARLAVHFHDTYGQALANILASLEIGVRTVDASVAGLGGCPYAPGASGNVATEDVVYLLNGLGMHSGVDIDALARTGQWISQRLGRDNQSRAGRALCPR